MRLGWLFYFAIIIVAPVAALAESPDEVLTTMSCAQGGHVAYNIFCIQRVFCARPFCISSVSDRQKNWVHSHSFVDDAPPVYVRPYWISIKIHPGGGKTCSHNDRNVTLTGWDHRMIDNNGFFFFSRRKSRRFFSYAIAVYTLYRVRAHFTWAQIIVIVSRVSSVSRQRLGNLPKKTATTAGGRPRPSVEKRPTPITGQTCRTSSTRASISRTVRRPSVTLRTRAIALRVGWAVETFIVPKTVGFGFPLKRVG